MIRKQMNFKVKGMNRDMSVSSFNPESSFENHNLRLVTNNSNTALSWVNEKGPKEVSLDIDVAPWKISSPKPSHVNAIEGTPIGTAVLNHTLVLFTTGNDGFDRIYSFAFNKKDTPSMYGKMLYKGNLNFSIKHPIETLVSYESDEIQKVYWTDNYNQPRVINIATRADKLQLLNSTKDNSVVDTFFDFVPSYSMKDEVTVAMSHAGGTFSPGVIQYCMTYFNKHGQETNIVYVSSLYYLSHSDRGASPEDTVSCNFTITIKNPDLNYDFIRLYSIQRTAIDGTPLVKVLDDIPLSAVSEYKFSKPSGAWQVRHARSSSSNSISDTYITYVDNGTTGYTVDATKLLYVGGKEILALTMADKDNTLFLGNLTQKDYLVSGIQRYYDDKRISNNNMGISFVAGKQLVLDHTTGIYSHTNGLNYSLSEMSTFKGGETYRFGFQLQKKTGEWTEPIFMNDVTNPLYPKTSVSSDIINLVYAQANINILGFKSNVKDFDSIYRRIRPVIVYPNINDRTILCQGVLNPTVFNVKDREDNMPFAQSSWFFRPYVPASSSSTGGSGESGSSSGTGSSAEAEIKNSMSVTTNPKEKNENPTITPDSYFKNLCDEVYVLIASATDAAISTIAHNHAVVIHQEDFNRDDDVPQDMPEYFNHSVIGIIPLGTSSNITTYAFISKDRWYEPYEHNYTDSQGNITGHALYEYNDVEYEDITTHPSYWYSSMSTTANGVSYYTQLDENSPTSYVYKFYTDSKLYTVTYTSIGKNTGTNYIPTLSDTDGESLRFRHYDSIYTTSDIIQGNAANDMRNVEIQGSIAKYKTPFGSESGAVAPNTNSQFFIDQSIVTLNSPDIEFDTNVQNYNSDQLHLRIIGAIPVTAYASAHSITTSSSMVEEYYNMSSSDSSSSFIFGKGELDNNIQHSNISLNAGKRLVSEYLWNDVEILDGSGKGMADENKKVIGGTRHDFMVYPWQRSGSLNNDSRVSAEASSLLRTKKMSHLLFSQNTEYFPSKKVNYNKVSSQIYLQENSGIVNMRLPKQRSAKTTPEVNYYPNVDKALFNSDGYYIYAVADGSSLDTALTKNAYKVTSPVPMKYRSSSHAVIALDADNGSSNIPILPYGQVDNPTTTLGKYEYDGTYGYTTFWKDTQLDFDQPSINMTDQFDSNNFSYLWIGELYKEPINRFGGTTESAIRSNTWLIAGDAVNLIGDNGYMKNSVNIKWTCGDTFYQRYDCMKTFAYTNDDVNQNVEILSFMCETRVNIDGRYDRNRGQIRNYNYNPSNFNLLNPVYSQRNNYFNYKVLDTDDTRELHYPNWLWYSMAKQSGADIDEYTNVTLASTMELDGDKGQLNSIKRFNNGLFAFQNTGISQILYNENAQIATTQGVPIELANSGKVQGKRYLSDTVGCSNKWAMATTPIGIYFMDSVNKGIYVFNGQLQDLSQKGGMNAWCKANIPSYQENSWTPYDFKGFTAYYDRQNQDVLFINKDTTLAYSEKTGTFTSFYDYGNTQYFCNVDDIGIWVKGGSDNTKLYKHQAGDYCNFFGSVKPYSMTLIGNQEPTIDKIFTNLELRASVEGDGIEGSTFIPLLPFDTIETWNEYQHGIANLSYGTGYNSMLHHRLDQTSFLKRKFRIWRSDIPRDKVHPMDRMRNPWIYLKLGKEAINSMPKVEIHDVGINYFE